ncbi:hypothetical protein TRFO_09038 [Tritrichomonas foetus]|uniref:Uncharacterized protein n=1 Tax=Tritrichomonas foetus TaxID=1144522 RepID=A0A1J4JHH8_9EUKA|nr:hypothetical protein TRFO_09038 [Tritrichomonas foetus]|eukprot:OHS98177.1 hypothetical protein TRFO_09038 [Tritrichomonas foetus]
MPPRGGKIARIKKPSIQTRDVKSRRGRIMKRSGGKHENDNYEEDNYSNGSSSQYHSAQLSRDNSSIRQSRSNLQRKDSWLDKLPPVIKPDEELHQKLSKERREYEKQKHQDFCRNELYAMLNIAMKEIDMPIEKREKYHSRAKVDFYQELLHDGPDDISVNKSFRSMTPASSRKVEQVEVGIKQLLDSNLVSIEEAFKDLSQKALKNDINFDPNPELDKTLMKINEGMQAYINQNDPTSLIEFPFLICVIGPPCSGKTTICQFITKYFDVNLITVDSSLLSDENQNSTDENSFQSIISSTDDKVIISSIINEIAELPPNKGVLIQGFPETKAQLTSLEKSLQTSAKKRGDPRFALISGLIRTNLSQEEAISQSSGRLIDKSTGIIFHSTFNPPNNPPNAKVIYDPEPNPPPSDFANNYPKLIPQLNTIENIVKKTGQTISIGLCESIGQLNLKIESFLKIIYKTKNLDVPFESFVVFETQEQFQYAKFCYDVFNKWNKELIPIFGKELGELYIRVDAAKDKIEYLTKVTQDSFLLTISRPDDRKEIADEFQRKNDLQNKSDFYHMIWQKSIEVRNSNYKLAEKLLKNSSIKTLKNYFEKNEEIIFSALLRRYFLVEWFSTTFSPLINGNDANVSLEIPEPYIPEFDPSNLKQLCTIFGLKQIVQRNISKSSLSLVNPNSNTTNSQNNLSTSFAYLQTPVRVPQVSMTPSKEDTKISLVDMRFIRKPLFSSKIKFDHAQSNNITPRDSPVKMTKTKKVPTKEENILNFLDYVCHETKSKVMKPEVEFMKKIFVYFSDLKKMINLEIDESLRALRVDLFEMIHKKCSREMEKFSQQFRLFKKGNEITGSLFNFDTSQLDQDCLEIFEKLDGKLPREDEQINIPLEKIKQFYKYYFPKGGFESLNNILQVLKELNFDTHELYLIEAYIKMYTLPDYIDVLPFIQSLAPDDVLIEEVRPKTPMSVSSLDSNGENRIHASENSLLVCDSMI